MSSVIYEGNKVNNAIHGLKALNGRFTSISSSVQSLTNAMISCKGFGHIGSSVSSTSFSSEINNSSIELDELVSNVRNMQVNILSYSNEENDIQEFLDDLDRKEFKSLDLSGIESSIGVGRKLKNGFTSLAATLFTAGAGVVEGVCDFVETGADLVVLGKSAVKSIFTGVYDLATGNDTTRQMWEETKSYVSEKKVESAFDKFYNETEFGQNIKNNAYGFDTVRGISSGLGYTAGIIGLNVVTGGLASGLGVGAAGSVGVGQLAATAGLMGFSSGTEDAWADGASISKGLVYGAANGAWEGTQWAIGAKINQYGGIGDKIASGIFKGGKSGAATRVVLDTVDSGLEGFVQPALKMIYKDYEGDTFASKYQNAFQDAGGWNNVRNQAIIGGIMSAGSEYMDARKILKSNSNGSSAIPNADVPTSKALGGNGNVEYRTSLASEDIFESQLLEAQYAASGNYSRSSTGTITGGYIKTTNTEFNTSTCLGTIPSGSAKFLDGSYVPYRAADSSLRNVEKYYNGQTFSTLLESRKETLSGLDYTRFKDASEIFESHGKTFNINELKLIVYHSEGNTSRIKNAISMSDSSLMPQDLDKISQELAKKLFPKSANMGANVERRVLNSLIDELQAGKRDTWKDGTEIFADLYTTGEALKRKNASTYNTRVTELRQMNNKGTLTDDVVRQIASSDGYPETIISILKKETNLSSDRINIIAEGVASKVFKAENGARIKAQYEILKGNYDSASNLVTGVSYATLYDSTAALFRASETFSQKAKRYIYYNTIDNAISDGVSKEAAIQQAKLMYGYALDQVGTQTAKDTVANLFKSNSLLFGYNDTVFNQFSSIQLPKSGVTDYMRQYIDGKTLDRSKMIVDFESVVKSNSLSSGRPFWLTSDKIDVSKTVAARSKYSEAFAKAAVNSSTPLESLKVMSKILELNQNGKSIFVYNNGGRTCSHNNGLTINLTNTTVDGISYGTIYHETGHFLFDNVLGGKLPTDFVATRQGALKNLYSAQNADLLKTVRKNLYEINMYSDYKANSTLTSSLQKKGFANIDAYKKYLVEQYSSQTVSERASTLLDRTKNQGVMLQNSFEREYTNNFDFDSALKCANLEISSMQLKAKDSIARSLGGYTKISGMIDSLTMSRDKIWYGHSREYFESKPNSNLFAYHELIADYTDLRVSGNSKMIGFMRQLFGNEMMDMLENTYQDMLK